MKLYKGTSIDFIADNNQNLIVDKLRKEFLKAFRQEPQPSEMRSWKESLLAVSRIFDSANLKDHGVLLEYQLPLTSKRLDCLICGKDPNKNENAVIIELKQWTETLPSEGENEVSVTWGVGKKELLHPSVQVGQYASYLKSTHSAFSSKNSLISLYSCAFLHNYNISSSDPLLDLKFSNQLEINPIFSKGEESKLALYLKEKLEGGDGLPTLEKIAEGKYNPPKKLMKEIGDLVRAKNPYTLLDDQLIVFDRIKQLVTDAKTSGSKTAVIVKGGPGTGKSVIALNLLGEMLKKGWKSNYATGSKSFTNTFRRIFGARSATVFKFFNNYQESNRDDLDLIICDEAHRIRESSKNRFSKVKRDVDGSAKKPIPQLYEILRAAKVSVFFIDDFQVVRPGEIGSIDYIRGYSNLKNVRVEEFELESQFRCGGSDGFINWLNNTLGLKKTPNVIWTNEDQNGFEVRILPSPEALDQSIREKVNEGFDARLVAGFCWEWSDPLPNGTLVEDVVIGEFSRAWNAKEISGQKLAPGIPSSDLWAYSTEGVNQVGCIYTAQGFEFDYVGVIIGHDLIYDFDSNSWKGNPNASFDKPVKSGKDKFVDYMKNTYKVLMTRGMKGCYFYFQDKDTERFFRSRIE